MHKTISSSKHSDFFYLVLALLALLWGYMGVPNDKNTMNIGILQYFKITKLNQILSDHYYLLAEEYLYELDNEASTQALVQAIQLDPYPFSARYKAFRKLRNDFLANIENKNMFYSQK